MPLIAAPLSVARIDQAWPLVHAIEPAVSVEQWRAYAGGFVHQDHAVSGEGAQRGIFSILDRDGYIRGLCSYGCMRDAAGQRCLTIEALYILDLFDAGRVAEEVALVIEDLARRLFCARIEVRATELAGQPLCYRESLADWLDGWGMSLRDGVWHKLLRTARAAE